jgi:hypothetical protein
MKRVQVNLTEKQESLLKAIARHKGISVSELLRRMVDEFTREPLNPQEVR